MWCLLNMRAIYLHPSSGTIQGLKPCAPNTLSGHQSQRSPGISAASVPAWRHEDQPVGHCGLPVCCGPGSLKKRLCNLFIVLSGSTLLRNICEEGWGVQDKGLNQSSRTLWCQNGPPNYHTLRQSGPDFKIPLLISHWMQGTRAWG